MSVDKDFDPIDFSHRAYEAFSKDFSKAEPYTNESSRLRLNILRFLKESEDLTFRHHSLFQRQPGADIEGENQEHEEEIMLYDVSGELIASFTLADGRSFKVIACYRSDKTIACYRSKFNFKFYAKNCDHRNLWSVNHQNNALYADRLSYYKPTEWDKNNNRYICLDKINQIERRPGGVRDFDSTIYSYPDNLPYVECDFFLNEIEFEEMVKKIFSKSFKRPLNFLEDNWPCNDIIHQITEKLYEVSNLTSLSHDNMSIIAEYVFYSQLIRQKGNPYFVLEYLSTEENPYDKDDPIFEATFDEQFLSIEKNGKFFLKEKKYKVSKLWQLQTLMMKRDALKKIIFGEMKAFVEFISDLYTLHEYEVETLFDKDFLDNFIFKFFKKK
jgi:hypothetical protein